MQKKNSTQTSIRRSPTKQQRELIRKKTGGLCHICGGRLGSRWVSDHVKPVAKGGSSSIENFLPACAVCNRLKWHREPKVIRKIMQLGIYCNKEIDSDTVLGREINRMYRKKVRDARARRKD